LGVYFSGIWEQKGTMKRNNTSRGAALAATAILFLAMIPQQMRAATGYVQHNLASDIPLLADNTDPNMVNPWGLGLSPFWPCNNGSGTYNINGPDGAPTATVTIVPLAGGKTGPGRCTGAVRNNNPAAFLVSPATATAAAVPGTWLLDTEDGLITIRSGAQNVIKVDNSASGAVYKGIALTNNPDYVYAANFSAGTIDVYDGTWAKATLAGSFQDPSVPAGFAPFNIQLLAGKLYVAYAKQDSTKTLNVNGPGAGYVAVFDTNGNLIKHLISTGSLNAPWGLAIAPPSFGTFANALLVGNFGDGKINAFDVNSGNLLGTLQDPAGNPIVNLGLWALTFGTSTTGNYSTTLYFTAGIPGNGGVIQSHGLFGAITTTAPPSIGTNGIVNGASFAAGPLAPGSIAAVFGTNLTDNGSSCIPSACNPTFRSDKRLTATLAGTQVQVNGVPAPMFYASPIQLGIQIPTELTAGGTATVQVIVDGQASTASTINIGEFSPGIFAGAITHANNTAVTTTNPAAVGETVTIYANGLGATSATVPTGEVPGGTVTTLTAPSVTIDGLPAQVDFSGLAGCCVGLNQINVEVPAGVRSGTNVPVVVSVGTQSSNTVNMATK
jgi:uncharacterized protein (TIGR03118 family)